MPGAIIIAEAEGQGENQAGLPLAPSTTKFPQSSSIATVEVLGRSVISRMVQHLSLTRIQEMAILVDSSLITSTSGDSQDLSPYASADVWTSARARLLQAKKSGLDTVIVMLLRAYIEFDPAELIQFHRDRSEPITQACDEHGPLNLWAVNPHAFNEDDNLQTMLQAADRPYYSVRGYVQRLETLRDLRRLCVDGLNSRCQLRPKGYEVRPGVWMAEGAQTARGARIVAPAYLGTGARIAEQCLVTRCSSIEACSHVDYGTAIEDSWVLPHTYLGIGLDLSHSIVSGNYLWNLSRDVKLDIKDPVVMRQQLQGKPRRQSNRPWRAEARCGEMALSAVDESTR